MSIASLMAVQKVAGTLSAGLAAAYATGLIALCLRIRFGPEWVQPSRAVQLVSRGFSAQMIIGFALFGWTGDRWANGLLVTLRVLLALFVPVSIAQGIVVQIEPTCMRMGGPCP